MHSVPARSSSVAESRQQKRFNATMPIRAWFGITPVDVLNLSGGGLQIEHSEPMRIGFSGEIRIDMNEEPPLVVSVRVAWSRLSSKTDMAGKFRYRSGVEIANGDAPTIGALGRLIRAAAQPDPGSLDRKRHALEQRVQARVSQAVVTPLPQSSAQAPNSAALELVRTAREFLASHRDEWSKWFARAKYSLANVQGFRSSDPPPQHVLAIWEYLGGKVELGDVIAAVAILDEDSRSAAGRR